MRNENNLKADSIESKIDNDKIDNDKILRMFSDVNLNGVDYDMNSFAEARSLL